MLTTDLLRVHQKNNKIFPVYVDIHDPCIRSMAETFITIYLEHQGQERKKLEDTLEEAFGQGQEVIFYRGLCKLLDERCLFEVPYQEDPAIIREFVFCMANQFREKKQFNREKVLEEAAKVLGINKDDIPKIMYSDLKQHHKLKEFKTISAENLLKRYNTALAQAILFKAISLQIIITHNSVSRYRQLFRAIKFCRLLYNICQCENGFSITLDGPISLFQSSQKYGLFMALFLPYLLFCNSWHLTATLQWKSKKNITFELSSENNLYSHYSDVGMYYPPEMQQFVERFKECQNEWEIEFFNGKSTESHFLNVGTQVCIPDYTFIHRQKNFVVYMEIFGFWHKTALLKKIQQIEQCQDNLLLAISRKMNVGTNLEEFSNPKIIFFHNVLHPKDVLEHLQLFFLQQNQQNQENWIK